MKYFKHHQRSIVVDGGPFKSADSVIKKARERYPIICNGGIRRQKYFVSAVQWANGGCGRAFLMTIAIAPRRWPERRKPRRVPSSLYGWIELNKLKNVVAQQNFRFVIVIGTSCFAWALPG